MERIKNLPMPNGMTRDEIIDLLLQEEYGYLPQASNKTEVARVEMLQDDFCSGKAELLKIVLKCTLENSEFSFPVYYTRLKDCKGEVPCFILINFRSDVPDKYLPSEELIGEGYAVLSFCYQDVTSDDGDFTNGLAGVVYNKGERMANQCGKIGLWAWSVMRVMDYAMILPELNHSRISVVGHSRLGKTALLAGALDERFYCVFSNNSGNSGAALARNSTGETIKDIYERFPYWFCENYSKYIDNEEKMPFDQHYLLSANSSHKVYVASAADDLWACPNNEYLSCVVADDYYEKHGVAGLVAPDHMPMVGDCFMTGNIGYHLRAGDHSLSREDWRFYINYLNWHKNDETYVSGVMQY